MQADVSLVRAAPNIIGLSGSGLSWSTAQVRPIVAEERVDELFADRRLMKTSRPHRGLLLPSTPTAGASDGGCFSKRFDAAPVSCGSNNESGVEDAVQCMDARRATLIGVAMYKVDEGVVKTIMEPNTTKDDTYESNLLLVFTSLRCLRIVSVAARFSTTPS